jgi:hypothetical protein
VPLQVQHGDLPPTPEEDECSVNSDAASHSLELHPRRARAHTVEAHPRLE